MRPAPSRARPTGPCAGGRTLLGPLVALESNGSTRCDWDLPWQLTTIRLEDAGATIVMPLVGRYATSMEMAGVSFTLCKLDNELEKLLNAPCDCAFWRVG